MVTLYKKDSKGKTRILIISAEGGELVQKSGLLGGGLVEHRKMCKAKNVGKTNATTPEEQAKAEMSSKVTEKVVEGYFLTLKEMEDGSVILPMLAKSYKEEATKVKWPVLVQPKLDGMRCLAYCWFDRVELRSRENKVIATVPHINEALEHVSQQLTPDDDVVILDGELYVHGETFQENMRRIRRSGPDTPTVQYWVYDIVEEGISYEGRLSMIVSLSLPLPIRVIETGQAFNQQALNRAHSLNLNNGFEGTMIRWGQTGYKRNGRSENLLKYKDFKDIAATITDVIPSDARPDQGVLVCKWGEVTFKCSLKLSHEERREVLTNKDSYIGRIAEVRYFEESETGVPRFPVCVGFREDKTREDDTSSKL